MSAPPPLTLEGFQAFIRDRYLEQDAARGTPGTFMWFIEEVGELATALHRPERSEELSAEFADVLGWLATLANLHGVDLERAVRRKYLERSEASGFKP